VNNSRTLADKSQPGYWFGPVTGLGCWV